MSMHASVIGGIIYFAYVNCKAPLFTPSCGHIQNAQHSTT